MLNDKGRQYREPYAKRAQGGGEWYSFDKGALLALVKVLNLKAGGLGDLG